MTTADLAEQITEALDYLAEDNGEEGVLKIHTYQDEGVLTDDEGLVIKLQDGSEFQVTIIQSKHAY